MKLTRIRAGLYEGHGWRIEHNPKRTYRQAPYWSVTLHGRWVATTPTLTEAFTHITP